MACAAVWYAQPGDWEHFKEDFSEIKKSKKFLDQLLASLYQKCLDAEALLFNSLTGSGSLPLAQAAFSLGEKRSQHSISRTDGQWAHMFLNFQLLDCLLWYRNCSLEGHVRVSAVQCPLGPRAEVEKDCSKLYAARFDWQEYFPDFVRDMRREMILDEKRKQISGNID